jgi:hypothetical protein
LNVKALKKIFGGRISLSFILFQVGPSYGKMIAYISVENQFQ